MRYAYKLEISPDPCKKSKQKIMGYEFNELNELNRGDSLKS